MKRFFYGGMLALSSIIIAESQATAATITYTAVVNGSFEAPPVVTPATGFATLTLNGDLLTVVESFTGLIGGVATAGHIHCCIAPGGNAPVVVPFLGFPNSSSGVYTNTFNLNTLLGAAGEVTLIAGLNSGMAYVNIHNAVNPGGEIRGLITATPEPATLLLSAGAIAGLMLRRRVLLNRRTPKVS